MRSDQRPGGRFSGGRPPQPQQRAPHRNQSFDSNGPNLKIRGSAQQIFERYVALAREAAISGDRVAAENFHQHAEHYFRISNEHREGSQHGTPPPTTPAGVEMNPSGTGSDEAEVVTKVERSQQRWETETLVSGNLLPPNQASPAPYAASWERRVLQNP